MKQDEVSLTKIKSAHGNSAGKSASGAAISASPSTNASASGGGNDSSALACGSGVSNEDDTNNNDEEEKEMLGGCCVCSDDTGYYNNLLVYCDGVGCRVAVHQCCYGIANVPDGSWYCRPCEFKLSLTSKSANSDVTKHDIAKIVSYTLFIYLNLVDI